MKQVTIFKTYDYLTKEELEDMEAQEIEFLKENYPDEIFTGADLESQIQEVIEEQYRDEELLLDEELENNILCIADIGTWHGRVQGYKVLTNNLKEVLKSHGQMDGLHVYYDGYNVKAEACHHDGVNHYLYREIRANRNIDNFLSKIFSGEKITRNELNYYTKSLRNPIKKVYGL